MPKNLVLTSFRRFTRQVRQGAVPTRSACAAAFLLVTLTLSTGGCAKQDGHAQSSAAPAMVTVDPGWTSNIYIGTVPGPQSGQQLVGVSAAHARLKWQAAAADVNGLQGADSPSSLTVLVVDTANSRVCASVHFKGTAGSGSIELPVRRGQRTTFSVTFKASGTYRQCSWLIEQKD
jgi:hypothetical protein